MSRTRKYAKRRYRSKRSKSRKRIRSRTRTRSRVKRGGGGGCRGNYFGSVPQILSMVGAPQPPFFVEFLNRRAPP